MNNHVSLIFDAPTRARMSEPGYMEVDCPACSGTGGKGKGMRLPMQPFSLPSRTGPGLLGVQGGGNLNGLPGLRRDREAIGKGGGLMKNRKTKCIPAGTYDNRETMRREGYYYGKLRWFIARIEIETYGAALDARPWGTHPDIPRVKP